MGLSVAGCGHNPNNYCIKNGHAYGIKTDQVMYVTLGPEVTGLSLAWGQTGTLNAPQAFNCNGDSATVSSYTYTSSNLLLADISPSGQVCAGTWNRNSPGGVPNFSICTPPSGASLSAFKSCTGQTCGTVQVTATGAAVTSNPVNVYIHPPISSITIPTQKACISQGQSLPVSLLAETTVTGPGGVTLCSPNTTACTSPSVNVGTITYNPVTTSVVTINNTSNPATSNPVTGGGTGTPPSPNGVATANLPGSTVINASNSQVTSAAGFFSTCAPASINLAINGQTSATVTTSAPQTIVATVKDSNTPPATINGLPLTYASTEPQDLTVSSTGLVTDVFPSHATVTAICQPPGCNPAPVNLIGSLGNGMPVAGNRINVSAPGRSTTKIFFASSQSPFFSEINLATGGAASPVRLPYTPNSMVTDAAGDTLHFGCYHELMTYSTVNNSLSKEVPGVPGVVLAASPTGSTAVVNDQLRHVIYLYSIAANSYTSIGGDAYRAHYTPDGTTVYIVGKDPATGLDTLWVNSSASGWSTYTLTNQPAYTCQADAAGSVAAPAYNPNWDPYCGPSLAVAVPSVAAFISGNTTTSHSYCPSATANPPYFPPAGDTAASTAKVNATADGLHILGADTANFSDIILGPGNPPTGVPVNACPAYAGTTPLTIATNPLPQPLPAGVAALPQLEIDQVVSSPDSSLAFVTYSVGNSGGGTGILPYYQPLATGGPGTLGPVQLSSGAQAPIAGAFSPDGTLFFVSTSGDNLVHEINTSATTPPTDSGTTLNPQLLNPAGTAVPAQFVVVQAVSSRT
ncbi:MAG: hypothetical protein ACLGXA_14235 [Acidobacteriota bacterium]